MAQSKRDKRAESDPTERGTAYARERRLTEINERLVLLGLAPMRKLGDYRQGEFELHEIVSDHSFRYFHVVVFKGVRPDGQAGVYAVVMNARHAAVPFNEGTVAVTGAVCLVTINDAWMILVKQHRPTLGRWTTEVPRGFLPEGGLPFGRLPRLREITAPIDAPIASLGVSDIPIGIIGQELAPMIVGGGLKIGRFSYLGMCPENTGISSNMTAVFWVNLLTETPDEMIKEIGRRKTTALKTQVVPLKGILDRWPEYGLESTYCLAAILMFHRARVS